MALTQKDLDALVKDLAAKSPIIPEDFFQFLDLFFGSNDDWLRVPRHVAEQFFWAWRRTIAKINPRLAYLLNVDGAQPWQIMHTVKQQFTAGKPSWVYTKSRDVEIALPPDREIQLVAQHLQIEQDSIHILWKHNIELWQELVAWLLEQTVNAKIQ